VDLADFIISFSHYPNSLLPANTPALLPTLLSYLHLYVSILVLCTFNTIPAIDIMPPKKVSAATTQNQPPAPASNSRPSDANELGKRKRILTEKAALFVQDSFMDIESPPPLEGTVTSFTEHSIEYSNANRPQIAAQGTKSKQRSSCKLDRTISKSKQRSRFERDQTCSKSEQGSSCKYLGTCSKSKQGSSRKYLGTRSKSEQGSSCEYLGACSKSKQRPSGRYCRSRNNRRIFFRQGIQPRYTTHPPHG
jgi:hypothetical protein